MRFLGIIAQPVTAIFLSLIHICKDVLTFVTEPLAEDVTLAGPVEASLKVALSTSDADFVLDVYKRQGVLMLSDAVRFLNSMNTPAGHEPTDKMPRRGLTISPDERTFFLTERPTRADLTKDVYKRQFVDFTLVFYLLQVFEHFERRTRTYCIVDEFIFRCGPGGIFEFRDVYKRQPDVGSFGYDRTGNRPVVGIHVASEIAERAERRARCV